VTTRLCHSARSGEPSSASARRAKVRGARSRSGFHRSAVVLVDRFDCRSRRAACGVVRSRAKSSRKRRGLVPPHRSEGRKSVGSRTRVAKPGDRWRVSSYEQATRRGKALRAGKVTSFLTKGWRKRSWRRCEVSASRRRDRERQRFVRPPRVAADKAAAKGRRLRDSLIGSPTRSSRRSHPRQTTGWRVDELAEAGSAPSERAATRAVRWSFGSSERGGGRESVFFSPRESDRSSRYSCREILQLQMSVRRIFSDPWAGEPRGEPVPVGVA